MINNFKNFFVFLILFLSVISCNGISNLTNNTTAQPVIKPVQYAALTDLQESIHSVAKNQTPSVVYISTEKTVVQNYVDPFNYFFGNPFDNNPGNNQPQQRKYKESALGSGLIFDNRGNKYYIMTNNHVIDSADSINVTIDQNKTYKAKLLGTDPNIDIAVVEITTNDKLVLGKLGDSGNVQVGDFVIAVGNPFALSGTLTFGIVSALGRKNVQTDIVSLTDFIQTDAAINPGNSGGPLLNIQGEVIGINTLIYSQSGGNVGIGFAIPINIAKSTAYKIIDKGKVEHGYLGIYYRELTNDDINTLGLKQIEKGMLITEVVKGSPAEKFGLKSGDVIIKLDNKELSNTNDLAIIIGNLEPGVKVNFTLLRDNKTIEKEVTIGTRTTNSFSENKNTTPNNNSSEGVYIEKYGLNIANLNADIRKKYNLSNDNSGVIITNIEANSMAQANRLQTGDLIYKINNSVVKNTDEIVKISKSDTDRNYFFIKRGNSTFIAIM